MNDSKSAAARKLMAAFMQFSRLNRPLSPIEGLRHSEIFILLCIRRKSAPDAPGIKVSEISSDLKVATPTITQQLRSLETQGYIERSADEQDRRAVRIRMTAKGECVINQVSESIHTHFAGLVDYLGEEKSEELVALLSKVFTYFYDR